MQIKFKKVFLSLYFLICVFGILAQPDLKFSTISIRDGLSSNSINDILMDTTGFLWVATDDGLNRFDGQEIKVFHQKDSVNTTLCNSSVNCLFETKKSQLLIGTVDGLCVYNSTYETFERLIPKRINVTHITQSQFSDWLYLSTDKGIFVYSEDFELISHFNKDNSILPTNAFEYIEEDQEGNIWVAAYTFGVFKITDNKKITSYTISNKKLSAHFVRCIKVRENGDILITSYDHGVLILNTKIDRFEEFLCENWPKHQAKVIELYEDPDEQLWVGLNGGGLGLYNDEEHVFHYYQHHSMVHSSINDDVITKVYHDKRGGLWVGSYYRGLNFVNLFSAGFTHLEEIKGASDHNIVSCVLEDSHDNLWMATDGGGIVHYNKKHELIESYNTDNSPLIVSNNTLHMAFDKDENLWVGTYFGGLEFIDTKNHKVEVFQHDPDDSLSIADDVVWTVFIDSKEQIWLGTQAGISQFDMETKKFKNFKTSNSPIKSDNVRGIYEDKYGDYWFGTEKALYRYDSLGVFHEYLHDINNANSICSNWIVTMNEDNNGVLWLGSYGGGISKYNRETDDFTSLNEGDGLCNNFICGILPDDNNDLWISTFKGLSHFKQKENTFKTYHEDDGLQGGKFSFNSYYKAKDGTLMFGGINGLTSFLPQHISSNPYPPKVVLTDFKLLNKSVDLKNDDAPFDKHISHVRSLELPYDYSVFTIHFASLNFIQSNKNQYCYRLVGFDEKWSYVGNKNEVTYTNLAPGKYVFELKASNNNEVWTEKPLLLQIIIKPPYYRTWWFRLCLSFFFVFALILVYRLRINGILRQKKLLKKIVDQRTRKLNQKTKELEYINHTHLESLDYAKLIQGASLSSLDEGKSILSDIDLLYLPSKIVSGDFYWIKEVGDQLIIAVVDCTGHGVPGAFMSLIGQVSLNNIVFSRGISSPEEILEELHLSVIRALHQEKNNNKDGMDISVVVIDKIKKTLSFSGAMNPLVYIQNDEMTVIKGERRAIGGTYLFNRNKFQKHVIDVSVPTTFYLYTDGYQDQFGGKTEDGQKFIAKRFRKNLLKNHLLSMQEQIEVLNEKHQKWKGKREQTDDILVLGGKIDL